MRFSCNRQSELIILTLLLLVKGSYSIRNLFIPRTGDIHINPTIIAENLSNVTNFQSLLGAGRSLAYPFAAGLLVSIATLANENNWKVSDSGFAQVLGIPREEIVASYGALLDMLDKDENITLSNMLFSLKSEFNPSEALTETLMTEVREVTWTRETWRDTYNTMVEHLSNVTNEKIAAELVPPVTKIGTPFRKSTEAVILSSFHYINGWQYPWTFSEVGMFQGNDGIPYLETEGDFFVSKEEEFTAVAVPLEGGTKNLVFVLPHVNLTSKYFRTQPEDGEKDEVDIVPFPKKWEMKKLRVKVPAFNTTDVDQYGQDLEQIGMNETFCTIIRDFFGRYPYYMRPMVQVNYLDFNEDFLELASATGVAVEKFQSFLSILNGGDKEVEETDDDEIRRQTAQKQSSNLKEKPQPLGQSLEENVQNTADSSNASVVTSTIEKGPTDSDIPTLSLDRSFLWYLNDSEVGPMFFGTVELLVNLAFQENSTEPGDDEDRMTTMLPPPGGDEMNPSNNTNPNNEGDINAILADIEKFYLWSCRSFIPTSGGHFNSSSGEKQDTPKYKFDFSFDDEENAETTTSIAEERRRNEDENGILSL